MSAHLSALELDELAAGLVQPPPHLAECEPCRDRLEALRASRAAFTQHPEAARVLARLQAQPAPVIALPRRRVVPVLAAGLALAAGLILLVSLPVDDDGTRLKGAVSVALLDAQGVAVTKAKVGQTVTLAVGGAGKSHAAVFALDDSGARTLLFPASGTTLGPIERGAQVKLRTFEVTPGAVTLIARFADSAVDVEAPALSEARVRLEVE